MAVHERLHHRSRSSANVSSPGLRSLMLRRILVCPILLLRSFFNLCFSAAKMVSFHGSHKRLQTYQHHYCSVCMTGLFGCRWHRYQQSKVASNKWDIIWFITLIIAFLYVVFMLDYWLVNQNSEDLVAWYLFDKFGRWDPVFDFLLALTGVCLAYVFIVLLMSLCHIGTGHQVYMHWGHRVALALILCGCVTITLFVSSIWSAGWSLMYVSLQISGPFIHVGLMFGMVCMTWLIADWWMQSSSKVRSAVCVGIYVALLSAILVFPPFLESPCVVESSQLPRKPRIIAHRGGAAVAPENTIAAFENAAKHGASTWESDVVISHDGVAFMHHDDTLRRTTNVQSVFPQNAHREACWFNFSQIQQLNSGSWFIQRDPFNTVRGLKDDQRRVYANQSIPTLLQYLELARNNNVRVLFDIKMWDSAKSCRGHPYSSSGLDIVVNAILESKILHHNVLWLYWDTHKVSHNFTRVASAKLGSHMTDPVNLRRHDVSIVNGQFDHLDTQKISHLRGSNISVNMYVVDASWLYSLYWCAGVESVTTNQIERLGLLQQPIWLLSPKEFQIMWLATDVIGCAVCLFIWIYQKIRHSGKTFHADSLSLPATRLRKSQRPMKEKLLHTSDSLQEIDAVGTLRPPAQPPSRWSTPVSTDGIIIEFPAQPSASQPSTLSGGSLTDMQALQLHRLSRTSGFSTISSISALSGNSQANESFEKD